MSRSITDPPPEGGGPTVPRLTADQVGRWADRIADGRDAFPAELADLERSALAAAVRARLRDRLVRLFARAAAEHLLGPRPGPKE
jgi:hypothetical protein